MVGLAQYSINAANKNYYILNIFLKFNNTFTTVPHRHLFYSKHNVKNLTVNKIQVSEFFNLDNKIRSPMFTLQQIFGITIYNLDSVVLFSDNKIFKQRLPKKMLLHCENNLEKYNNKYLTETLNTNRDVWLNMHYNESGNW